MFILFSISPEPNILFSLQLLWNTKFVTAAHLELFSPLRQKLTPPPVSWSYFTWSCPLAWFCQKA